MLVTQLETVYADHKEQTDVVLSLDQYLGHTLMNKKDYEYVQ